MKRVCLWSSKLCNFNANEERDIFKCSFIYVKDVKCKKTTFYVVVVFKRNMRNVYVQKTNIKLFLYNLNAVLTLVNLT